MPKGYTPMRSLLFAAILCVCAGMLSAKPATKASGPVTAPEADRVKAVAAMLAETPAGFGRPIADRAAWEALARAPAFASAVEGAAALLAKPLPDSPDDLYLDFSRTGNRTRWQKVAGERRGRIMPFVLAECFENRGRFIRPLEDTIAAVCAERTWVMPAHDRGLANFEGKIVRIDLGSSHLGVDLATADYLVGERLGAKSRGQLRENVRRRILDPILRMLDGRQKKDGWMSTTNNWNAVCLANVTGTALALAESREERARFIVAAETYSRNFLKGFTADGYCSEGVGYWGYGFGHYLLLAEAIHQATGGGVDLFAREGVLAPARYASRIEITGGVCPAFADCGVTARPDPRMMHFVSRRFGLGGEAADDTTLVGPNRGLFGTMAYSFPNSATRAPPAKEKAAGPGIRTWFPDAGVLIGRPADGSACRMGVGMKGGHNAEHHNHNDVGSYVVVVGKHPVLVDPGAEVYTARTFSGRRYDSNVLNSFGHPVPRVAGRLQKTGREARGQVVRSEFTEAADTLVLDLRSAYGVKEAERLGRTFVYSRAGAGSLTVTDEVVFTEPQAFETALVTLGTWKQEKPGVLVVSDSGESVRVEIAVTGGEFEVAAEEIKEDVKTHSLPTRIAIRMKQPVAKATVTMTIRPLAAEGR